MKCKYLIPLLALSYVAVACGGSSSDPPTSGAFFITDSLDAHDHVWVTITKVALTTPGGAPVDVFNDPLGQTVDLKTLSDGSGQRYAFFGKVRSGTYTAITITVDKDLVLFSGGSTTGDARVFAGNDGTIATLALTFAAPVQISPNSPMAIDFDLTNWTDGGIEVTGNPFLAETSETGIDNMLRHEAMNLHGTVRDLSGTAPAQTFRMDLDDTADVSVTTTSDTVISGVSSLSDGTLVRVRGTFSTTTNAFVATSIVAEAEDSDPQFEGPVSNIALDGSFDITVEEAENTLPMFTTVHVITDVNTVFTDVQGQVVTSAEFFLVLLSGERLEVKGSYDVGTNIMTAVRVEYEHEVNGDP